MCENIRVPPPPLGNGWIGGWIEVRSGRVGCVGGDDILETVEKNCHGMGRKVTDSIQ